MGEQKLTDWADESTRRAPGITTPSFEELSQIAYKYLNEQQAICFETYKIGEYENWFYDQLTGEPTFSDNGDGWKMTAISAYIPRS